MRNNFNRRSPLVITHRSLSSSPTTKLLESLENEANRRPQDTFAQLRLLQELNRNQYENLVVQRFESGFFAREDEAVVKEYIKALVALNKFDSVRLEDLRTLAATPHRSSSSLLAQPRTFSSLFRPPSSQPVVQVQLVEPDLRTQLLKTARFVLLALLLYQLTASVVEDINIPKQMGVQKDVKPQLGLTKTFNDVRGANEAKEELKEIVAYLKDPARFTRLGGKLPKGVLLTGPPGTGKTLLAKAIAGEAGVPFYYASGSEFEEMYVGVGARRIRDLFSSAKKHAPCIVFIDEIDAIGSTRALKEQQAMKMTLNQLLVELDGFKESEGVIIIGATNFPEILDPALIRPGRFDRNVVVPLPDVREREEILDLYLSKVPHEKGVDKLTLARGTPGLSGADLSNMVNIAALRASTEEKLFVSMEDLEFAKDKILMGGARVSAVIPEQVRKVTAWHESGHALVAYFTDGAMPLHKATVMPRGPALGMVVQLPEESDLLQRSKKQLLAEMDVCMGGRVAEEIVFGEDAVTSGASSDIQKATEIATRMVKVYGMSDKIGIIHYEHSEKNKTNSKEVDDEVRRILKESYDRVKNLMQRRRVELGVLANTLLEYETLTSDEIDSILRGSPLSSVAPKALPRSKEAGSDASAGTGSSVILQKEKGAIAKPQKTKAGALFNSPATSDSHSN